MKDDNEKEKRKTNNANRTARPALSFFDIRYLSQGTTLNAVNVRSAPAVVSTMYSPGASGASVISTRRQRVPSASSRIVAVTGTFRRRPVRPSRRAAMPAPSDAGVSTMSRSVRRNRKSAVGISRGPIRLKNNVPVPRGSASSVKMTDSVDPSADAPFVRIKTLVIARFQRCRRRDRNLRDERPGLERCAPFRNRLAGGAHSVASTCPPLPQSSPVAVLRGTSATARTIAARAGVQAAAATDAQRKLSRKRGQRRQRLRQHLAFGRFD